MEKTIIQPICVQCGRKIRVLENRSSGVYLCRCGTSIPYEYGIYLFADQDDFYEGRFTATHEQTGLKYLASKILSYVSIDDNEERHWRRAIKEIKKAAGTNVEFNILNVGAGGGHSFLKSLGTVTSVDLSLASLVEALDVSDCCYQADCTRLPFEDGSFDVVFSSHLLGHITLSRKDNAIKEIFRVTKPGGYSLHSIECEAKNFVYRRAKRYPKLYEKYFKAMYGHYGIELPSECKARFRAAGFVSIIERSDYCKGLIRSVNSYEVWFGQREYYEKDVLFKILRTFSKILSCNVCSRKLVNIVLYPFTILNHFFGEDSVDSIKVLYVKP